MRFDLWAGIQGRREDADGRDGMCRAGMKSLGFQKLTRRLLKVNPGWFNPTQEQKRRHWRYRPNDRQPSHFCSHRPSLPAAHSDRWPPLRPANTTTCCAPSSCGAFAGGASASSSSTSTSSALTKNKKCQQARTACATPPPRTATPSTRFSIHRASSAEGSRTSESSAPMTMPGAAWR